MLLFLFFLFIFDFFILFIGGGFSLSDVRHSSIFAVDSRFCEPEGLRQLEKTQLNLFQAFFFAAKINKFTEKEVRFFGNAIRPGAI